MKDDRTCQHCSQTFFASEGRVFSNHVRWCAKRASKNGDHIVKMLATKESISACKYGPIVEYSIPCSNERCTREVKFKEREKLYPQKSAYFCSRSCANSRGPRNENFKEKVRDKLRGRQVSERRINVCHHCHSSFETTPSVTKKFCTATCRIAHRSETRKNDLRSYRQLASFNFNLADFPEEFDFSLIERHGWYKPANRGNNLNGVSRDHIVSIKFGHENRIDPKIIAHPANCQLILHNDNVSKGKRSSMSFEQLQQRILEWNSKYLRF